MKGQEGIENLAESEPQTSRRLFLLFVLGFFIIVAGIVVVMVAAVLSSSGSASFGGIIFIGPIPIVFGSGPGAQWLILFAILLAVLSIVMFLITRRRSDKEGL
jgi:uncharacterized membrane protein